MSAIYDRFTKAFSSILAGEKAADWLEKSTS